MILIVWLLLLGDTKMMKLFFSLKLRALLTNPNDKNIQTMMSIWGKRGMSTLEKPLFVKFVAGII